MKYIIFERTVSENCTEKIPVIFPNNTVHLDVSEYFIKLYKEKYKSDIKAVSAGFINFDSNGCYGESTTLGLKSSRDDNKLINFIDYKSVF